MVRPIQEETNFKKMARSGYSPTTTTMISLTEIDEARKAIHEVEVNEGMIDLLIKLRRSLAHGGIHPTDRTYKTCVNILRTEAFLQGRTELNEDDFDILRHVLWTDPKDERPVWTIILDQISPEKGKIVTLFEDAREVAEATLAEKDSKKRMEKGIDTATKLKVIKTRMQKLIDAMEKKNKPTKEVRQYQTKVNELLARVFSDSCGINPEVT